MKIDLQHKKALVGGSTQGLGKAIAVALAKCGASVTLLARNEEKLKSVLNELDTSFNQKHQYLVVDFADFNSFKSITTNYFNINTVDILVNNTNGPEAGNIFEKSTEQYQEAFDLLFKTTQHLTMLALPNMMKANFGRIINTASISVKTPLLHLTLSNSIRAAVVTWAKTLSLEVAAHGITVNTILTGIFNTERIKQLNEFQAKEKKCSPESNLINLTREIPMQRLGKPEEFGYLVCFLASNYASFITGANIPIDGGMIKSL
jgi:3-oxoacyl-[acyl-carrier protein] reductase